MSDMKVEGIGSSEQPNSVPQLDVSNGNNISDSSESPSEVFVDDFIRKLDSEEADNVKNDIKIDVMDSSGDAEISLLSMNDETCSDEAQTTLNSAEISVQSVGVKSIRRIRFKRSQLGKQKRWNASVYSSRLKSKGRAKRKQRTIIPNYHIMQNYRETIERRNEDEINCYKNRAVNEFILDIVMKLKMEKEALFEQVIQLKEKSMDAISVTSSDALLTSIGGAIPGEKSENMPLETVQKQLKDEEEKARKLGEEAAILRREKAKLTREAAIARKDNADLKKKIEQLKFIMK